ncbi:MAG: hypothetical protein AB7E72_15015 [Lysobacterales bacterium]
MIPNSIAHALMPDIVLQAPSDFQVRQTSAGWSASEAHTGAQLSVLLKASAVDSVSEQRLTDTALALLHRKHPGAEASGPPEQVKGKGWQGQVRSFRVRPASGAPLHLVLTTLISADPQDPRQQRNLIALVEVAKQAFDQRPVFYRRLIEDRLLIGDAASAALEAQAQRPPAMELTEPADESAQSSPSSDPAAARTFSQGGTASNRSSVSPDSTIRSRNADRGRKNDAASPAVLTESDELRLAAEGQRVLALSVLLSIVVRAVVNVGKIPEFFAYALPAAVLLYAISGVLKICSAFGHTQRGKLALMFCSSVPLLGIACWVYLSIKTTRRLRAAGFEVGLLGVRS